MASQTLLDIPKTCQCIIATVLFTSCISNFTTLKSCHAFASSIDSSVRLVLCLILNSCFVVILPAGIHMDPQGGMYLRRRLRTLLLRVDFPQEITEQMSRSRSEENVFPEDFINGHFHHLIPKCIASPSKHPNGAIPFNLIADSKTICYRS